MSRSVARLHLLFCCAALLPANGALAHENQRLLDAMVDCAQFDDGSARLQCFDRLTLLQAAARLDSNRDSTADPGPTSMPAPPAEVAATEAPPGRRKDRDSAVERAPRLVAGATPAPARSNNTRVERQPLYATIKRVEEFGRGIARLYLDNGEVWQENERDPFTRYESGDAVVIRPGALGSFNLLSEATGRRSKVRKIR